jgi:hypothetical protein
LQEIGCAQNHRLEAFEVAKLAASIAIGAEIEHSISSIMESDAVRSLTTNVVQKISGQSAKSSMT